MYGILEKQRKIKTESSLLVRDVLSQTCLNEVMVSTLNNLFSMQLHSIMAKLDSPVATATRRAKTPTAAFAIAIFLIQVVL